MYTRHPFSLKLKKPLNLTRRSLNSPDPMLYQGEFVGVRNKGKTGYGEVINSVRLAQDLARWHLAFLEEGFEAKLNHQQVPVAAMMESPNILEAREFVAQGFKTLKFKVGKDWALEAECLTEIRSVVGPHIDIRLDANRAFALAEAIEFGKRVAGLKIAYFEEPLQDFMKIPEFVQATGIPVALDETLAENPPILEGVSTYALKPFMMPSLQDVFERVQLAQSQGIDLALCSAFESPYSLNWLVLLAAMLPGRLLPAGLSTVRWFEGEECSPTLSAQTALFALNNESRLPF